MRLRALVASLAALICTATLIVVGAPAAARSAGHAVPRASQQCSDSYPATRDPANPLMLAQTPGADPLTGARFFIDGPAHGAAAGAIAQLLQTSPASYPNTASWTGFWNSIQTGPLHSRLSGKPGLANEVTQLAKIASEPEVQRVSSYSQGGGPGGIFAQTQKLLCSNLQADPGSVLLLNTYFLHASLGGCPSVGEINGYGPTFRRRVDEVAEAVARRPVVFLLETDALGSSGCISSHHSLGAWEGLLRYEVTTLGALAHAVTYVEAGYSDANSVAYTARALNSIGIQRIRGFYTNDTHLNWTTNEIRWATAISKRTHGAHFIVNTAQNGNGPLLNKHPSSQGIEDLCNPPGRALGPRPTTSTNIPLADAWLWTSPPGNSSGCGGGPSGGVFWAARGLDLAEHANGRLGPGYPNDRY